MFRTMGAALGIGAAALLTVPSSASACGGLFCDVNAPVNQQAERIIFARGENGSVTAVIEIQYEGPSENFAWVLPVTGSPDIGVSSNRVLDQLQSATNPSYRLNTTVEGTCMPNPFFAQDASVFSPPSVDAGSAPSPENPVMVVDQGRVGPYDYTVISVDPTASPRAQIAVDWLQTNGYDVNADSAELLEPYLVNGQNLLAFRLSKGNDTGSIRPVIIDFGVGQPSIPIRPTAVAAVDNMGVMVWVLGESRAIPVNYHSLELNDALINWFNANSNYNDVVNIAADEAGGRGFVTEMASGDFEITDRVWSSFMESEWQRVQSIPYDVQTFMATVEYYSQFEGFSDVVREFVPPPEGVSADEFARCPFCNDTYQRYAQEDSIPGFDRAAYLAALQEQVITPVAATAAILASAPYMTRLYTTMSAAEMTMDPSFDFNPTLPAVDNRHVGERVIHCSEEVTRADAPWTTELPSGLIVQGRGSVWPIQTGRNNGMPLPANLRVMRLDTSGPGAVTTDNMASIQSSLDAMPPAPIPGVDAGPNPSTGTDAGAVSAPTMPTSPASSGDGACSVSFGSSGAGAPWMMAFGLISLLIRRRR